MPPFSTPKVVLSGLKERFESLIIVSDRVYFGSSTGNLHVYGAGEGTDDLSLVEVKKGLVKRSIDQLGFIKDVNSLVVLSEMNVGLFPLPSLSLPTFLPKAKAAFSFAVHSYVVNVETFASPSTSEDDSSKRPQPVPSLITILFVGCRRRAVIYSWKDGEPQEVKEAPLPHSARSITFLNNDTACLAYSPTEFAIFSLTSMSAADIALPMPVSTSGTAMNALSGLTGYMTLGLGVKAKPAVVQVTQSGVLLAKDGQGLFINTDGKISRPAIDWPAPPEEIAFVNPYLFSIFPAGTVPTQTSDAAIPFNQTALIEIRSSLSLRVSQTITFPFDNSPPKTSSPSIPSQAISPNNAQIRLMTPSAGAKSPLYVITTPIDKTTALNDGSSLWRFDIKPWTEQIDELVLKGMYPDALALLDVLVEDQVSDKDQRRIRIRALNAVSQFHAAKFDEAINTFIDLDFNPAKVVALYPESVAGRISVPQDRWISLYGGSASMDDGSDTPAKTDSDHGHDQESGEKDRSTVQDDEPGKDKIDSKQPGSTAAILDAIASGTGSMSRRLGKTGLAGLQALLPTGSAKDDDASSIAPKKKVVLHDDLRRSVETLVRYLSDRRPKLSAALSKVGITPESQSHLSPLSEASIDELFSLPNAPLSNLTPDQLLRFAQIVDTALYKSYLIIRPALLGSLCRVVNWCEVSEVEDDLRARKKFAELKDLYHGKKMHSNALDLLKELSQVETDMDDKLSPSIHYLQKLGPEYIDQVFKYARWVLDTDQDMGFQIFTSEDVELPREAVADYLEEFDLSLCAKFLEFIITERHEEVTRFHDRLAELYLDMTLSAKKDADNRWKEVYSKLLAFIASDSKLAVDRLYGLTSGTDLYEARAILLGRLGRHDQALETYVYRLRDYQKAEEYCKRIYKPETENSGVFLTLLRIYLRPTEKSGVDLLPPALDLISRHSPRLDSVKVLQLLPPLVTTDTIRAFLFDSLRAPVFDARVVGNISKARSDQLSRKLMALQTKRVKVTDSRICPHCHKRIGNSVIAVHVPHGEVTHYQCREPFSRRLKERGYS